MHRILIALDSVGIDPLGHDRPESDYSQSRFLFPRGKSGPVVEVRTPGWNGVLVETEVVDGQDPGAIECAILRTAVDCNCQTESG